MHESQIFANALRLVTPAERAAYLDAVCGHDPALRAGVEALLRAHATDPGFLEQPAGAVADTADLPTSAPAGERTPVTGVAEQAGVVLAGRYKLIEPIGDGGMGTVWMAQQTEPIKRLVAVKLIKAGMDSKAVLARFEAERQALALMDHPNIARVFDAGAAPDGRPFFVMELVKGRPITAYCDQHHVTLRQRLELFVPVCQAIQHAHQKGIIHRDVKPNNVLVALYDDRPVPKVIDFGVAKATGQQLTEKTLHTGFGAVVGTPEYMSPEQASFNQLDVDTRSDVYSLGVLLYELLAGSPPFSRRELAKVGLLEILRVIREQEPPRPSTKLSTADGLPSLAANRGTEPARLARLIRGDLDWIVMKALEKDRTRRYETTNGFAADVQRYLADEAVHARPPSAWYRLRKLVRRNRGMTWAAAVVLLALGAGVVGTVWQAVVATGERNAKQRALDDLGQEQQKTTVALDQSRLLAAELAFDKGQLLGESGDANLALLWLTRALQLAPPDATALRDAVHAGLGAWQRQVHSLRIVLPKGAVGSGISFDTDSEPRIFHTPEGTNEIHLRKWNTATGQSESRVVFRFEGEIGLWQFNTRDGFILVCRPDGRLQRYNLDTGKLGWERQDEKDAEVTLINLTKHKTALIAYKVGDAGMVRQVELATGKQVGPNLPHAKPVYTLDPHPKGEGFVTASGTWGNVASKAEIRFWDNSSRETRKPLEYPSLIMDMTHTADGDRLLTGHWDNKARIWDLAGNNPLIELPHEAMVSCVSVTSDGKTILTGAFDHSVRLWDQTGRPLGPPLRHDHLVQTASFSPDDKRIIVSTSGPNVRVWELAPVVRAASGRPHEAKLFPRAVSRDGRTILTQDAAGVGHLWNVATNTTVGAPLPVKSPILLGGPSLLPGQRAACSSDGCRAVTMTAEDGTVAKLWDTTKGTLVADLKVEGNAQLKSTFHSLAFSPDSKYVVGGTFIFKATVWEAATGKLHKTLNHTGAGPVFHIAFTPDSKTVLTAGADRSVRFWDVETGKQLGEPLDTPVVAMSLSPDATRLAIGDINGKAELWDVATRKRLFHLSGHTGRMEDTAFSPNGRFFSSASRDRTVRLWDVATGRAIGPPMVHPGPVVSVRFGADGRTLLTATEEQTLHTWDLAPPVTGTAEQLALWAEVTTGLELEPDGGIRLLDAAEWQERRQQLTTEHRSKPSP